MHSPFFTPSILIALFVHGLLLFLLVKLGPQIPEKVEKSIPVLLVSPDQHNQAASKTVPPSQSYSQKKITTTSDSRYKQTDTPQKNQSKPNTRRQNQSTDIPDIPSIATPNLAQSRRTNVSNTGLQNLFGQNKSDASQKRKQLSSKDLPNLSDYELSLLQRLSRKELYREYHQVLEQHERDQIDFSIEIVLFSNGAIKKAKIHQSSQIPQIDELAIRTAYNASPYDRPPSEDLEKGFKYIIPISYQKP